MRALSADQRAALAKFSTLKVGALFMACGTGKTQTATAIVNSIDNIDCLIWLCPCRCKDNTRAELEKCGLRYTPHIFGIESMSASAKAYDEARDLLASTTPDRACIVLDESLTIKNGTSKRTKRIKDLGKMAEYKWILNGTPITRNIVDVYSQMQFLSPHILECSLTEFKSRYCITEIKPIYGRPVEKIIGAANVEHLQSVIEPYTYTCSIAIDVEKRYYIHDIKLTDAEMEEYKERKADLIAEYRKGGQANMGAVFAKLLHAYCVSPAKFRALDKILHGENGEDLTNDTIVFCRFIQSAENVQARYPKLKVLTYGKGSIGLNLQEYCRIVYFDKTWDYAYREQSEARIHRTGQKRACEYHDITTNTGIDQLIDKCIAGKQNLLNVMMKRGDLNLL